MLEWAKHSIFKLRLWTVTWTPLWTSIPRQDSCCLFFGSISCIHFRPLDVTQHTPGNLKHLRLHLSLMLRGKVRDSLLVLGICCSTYVPINKGTNLRCHFLPTGSPTAQSVYRANKLTARPDLREKNVYLATRNPNPMHTLLSPVVLES